MSLFFINCVLFACNILGAYDLFSYSLQIPFLIRVMYQQLISLLPVQNKRVGNRDINSEVCLLKAGSLAVVNIALDLNLLTISRLKLNNSQSFYINYQLHFIILHSHWNATIELADYIKFKADIMQVQGSNS
jgi:hypothetical protein